MKLLLLLLVSCSLTFSLSEFNGNRVPKESSHQWKVPRGWSDRGLIQSEDLHSLKMDLTISLRQNNVDKLERIFWEVSDPQSPNYGQYLSVEDITAIVRPSVSTQQKVVAWLKKFGVDQFSWTKNRDYLKVSLNLSTIQEMFDTEMRYFLHGASGRIIYRSVKGYSVPQSLSESINLVHPLIHFPLPRFSVAVNSRPSSPDAGINPAAIRQIFQIPDGLVSATGNNSQAVPEFEVYSQYFSPTDLTKFQQENSLLQQQPKVVGTNKQNLPGVEAMLDIEYIMGIGQNVTSYFYCVDGEANGGQEPFLDWLYQLGNESNVPWVHSVSYGDYEDTVSNDYKSQCDVEFQKLGARGVSVFISSGDDGTGCTTNCQQFVPNWPATSPYVTAVGGVAGSSASNLVGDPISSGGFSFYFSRPSYQNTAVNNYLTQYSSKLPPSTLYNAAGRAVPDIASFSENVAIVYRGLNTAVGGTSCAAPVVAGVFALINDARFQQKKPSIGFANPFIYQTLQQHTDAFIDITTGNNKHGCCAAGFSAQPGWDPITGAGAPIFATLKQYALAYTAVDESDI